VFISVRRSGYTRGGEQFAQGRFLVLTGDPAGMSPILQDKRGNIPLSGTVVYARMSQLGHFMMANVRLAGQPLTISGPYGGDGLPVRSEKLTLKQLARFVMVPPALAERFWHDARGVEGDMRAWAKATFR